MFKTLVRLLSCLLAVAWFASSRIASADELDATLRAALSRHEITPIQPDPDPPPQLFELGKMLFYDRILSGNKDTSCATCHHDLHKTGDELSLSYGTRGAGLGPKRLLGVRSVIVPRNATDLFNRGVSLWRTQFWDSRVRLVDGKILTPARSNVPPGLNTVLEVQAMFPVTSRDEMRGEIGDDDVNGEHNELADFDDPDTPGLWAALTKRLLAIDGYRKLFKAAYPDVPQEELGFQHAAKALAAYEAQSFRFLDAPWDKYVAGDDAALPVAAKRGAILFYGRGRCAHCHSGGLLTDQEHHNLLVPQLGPGREPHEPLDPGRFQQSADSNDMFAFRTPPLRNVTVTGPWMHNGAYTKLEAAVRHHSHPVKSFIEYDRNQLFQVELRATVKNSHRDLIDQLPSFAARVLTVPEFGDAEMQDLLSFLKALESPTLDRLATNIPAAVPSGLPVEGKPVPPRTASGDAATKDR